MKVTAYLVVRAKRNGYTEYNGPYKGQKGIDSVTINRVLAKPPPKSGLTANEITVPIELDVPFEWFMDAPLAAVQVAVPVPPKPPEPTAAPVPVGKVTRGRKPSAAAAIVQP
jgi:hypothetical protein